MPHWTSHIVKAGKLRAAVLGRLPRLSEAERAEDLAAPWTFGLLHAAAEVSALTMWPAR
jgi:hypothetical protein